MVLAVVEEPEEERDSMKAVLTKAPMGDFAAKVGTNDLDQRTMPEECRTVKLSSMLAERVSYQRSNRQMGKGIAGGQGEFSEQ